MERRPRYLFMSVVRRGYRFSCWAYPWTVLSEYLGAIPVPVSQRRLSMYFC